MFSKEVKLQLYFGDDNSFRFVKREINFASLVEKRGESIIRAWKHFFSNQIPFAGYKKMPAGHVSLGFSRDIILDPFNRVPSGIELNKKPASTKEGMKKWVSGVAENQRHIYRSKRETAVWTSRVTWGFLGVLLIMVLVWAFAFLKGYYA